jgi:2'-5' RNA ligase
VTDSWRCFVAVPLPAILRAGLRETITGWRNESQAPDLRWTAPEGWHLTLAFLGDTDPGTVPRLLDGLRAAVGDGTAWTAATGSLGTFPGPRRARVLWYGVEDPDGRLAALAEAVRSALEPMAPSLRAASAFRAHVTLARARDPRGSDLAAWITGRRAPAGSVPIGTVVLYRSHLGGGHPARYEALGSALLKAHGGAMMDTEPEASVDD